MCTVTYVNTVCSLYMVSTAPVTGPTICCRHRDLGPGMALCDRRRRRTQRANSIRGLFSGASRALAARLALAPGWHLLPVVDVRVKGVLKRNSKPTAALATWRSR